MTGEIAEEARERRGDGVEPGDHQQTEDVEELLAGEPLALDLGGEEPADQVVAGIAGAAPLVEQAR